MAVLFAIALFSLATSDAASTGESFVFSCRTGAPARAMPCRVCLISQRVEIPIACAAPGERLAAAPGRYALRAHADGLSLTTNEMLDVRARPRAARARPVSLTLSPGATARPVAADGNVEFLSLETPRREIWVAGREADVPMPVGDTVAILRTPGGGVAGVSRPARIEPGVPAVFPFEPPAAGSGYVIVRGERPAAGAATGPTRIRLASPSGSREAGAATRPAEAPAVAIFYDVPAGPWRAELVSDFWWAVPVPVEILSGEVALIDGLRLLPRPTLTVELNVDPSLAAEPPRLTLRRCAPGEWSTAGPLDFEKCPESGTSESGETAVFARIAPEWHLLEARVGDRRLRTPIDLRAGADLRKAVDIAPTRLSGRVRRGRRTVPADLTFECVEDPTQSVSVRAGPDGVYRANLWPQGAWRVHVSSPGVPEVDAPLYGLDFPLAGEVTRNFDLPPTEVRVAVVDEKEREGIPGAEVAFVSFGTVRWRACDESGEVRLSAVPPGRLELTVEADGYRTGQASFEIEEFGGLQSLEVKLSPLDRENAFTAVLSDGAPAAGARVVAGAGPGGVETERAICDGEGICRLAERPADGETLLLAHPDAGVTAVPAAEALRARRVRLSAPGGILRLRPVRGAQTNDALLQVYVGVAGATLPPASMDSVATAIARPSRTSVYPGAVSGFFLSGLPAGPISVTIAAAPRDGSGAFGTAEAVAGPVVLELPAAGIAEIELP